MAKPEEKFLNKKHQARADREKKQMRLLTLTAIAIAVIVVGLVGFALINEFILKPNKAVAVVGNEKISVTEFQTRVRYSRFQILNQMVQYQNFKNSPYIDASTTEYINNIITQLQSQLDATQTMGQQALDQLVDEAIIVQEAAKRGITVSDAEIDALLQESFGFFPDGTPTPTITPTEVVLPTASDEQLAFLRPTSTPAPTATADPSIPTATPTTAPTLAPTIAPTEGPTPTAVPTLTPYPTSTPITLEGYKDLFNEQLDTYKSFNFSEKDLRGVIKNYLLREKLTADMTKDLTPKGDQVWARHILVATEDEAKAVYTRVTTGGEDWYDVAAEVSTDESNKGNGGDLGWFGKGAMDAEFEDAAYKLGIGEISQPVQTQFGWHIIQVIGHEIRPLTATEFESAKEKVVTDWLEQTKTELNITINDDLWMNNVPTDPAGIVPSGQS